MNKMFMLWGTILFTFGCWKVLNMDTIHFKIQTENEMSVKGTGRFGEIEIKNKQGY